MRILAAKDAPDLARAYDYVIVGGGSAGCVLASRLTEDAAVRVLLVEAGPSDRGISEIASAKDWVSLSGSRYDYNHVYAPAPHAYGRRIPIPRGKVLGGSSSINAMMWNRCHPSDFDRWASEGAAGWDYASVLPYFRACEDWEGGATALRGAGGPLRIERPRDPHPLALAFIEGALERGFAMLDDGNGETNEGVFRPDFNMRGDQRWSAATGYLHAAAPRGNLTILTGAVVTALLFEGRACVGVQYAAGAGVARVEATREVLLCAGAFETPRLLMNAGVGPADDLRRLGLAIRVDLPGVGQNFQDHPLLMGMNFLPKIEMGPVRHQGGGAILNWKSHPDSRVPDLHAFVVQGPHAGPELRAEYDIPSNAVALSPGLMRSESRGYVRLLGTGPDAPLEIQPNYFAERADFDALVSAVDTILDIAQTKAMRAVIERPIAPAGRLDRAGREHFVRLSVATFYHCCGTCAMGTGADSVVDLALRVHGLERLRVVDASVMPTIPSGNTHVPVTMIAERAADLIRRAA